MKRTFMMIGGTAFRRAYLILVFFNLIFICLSKAVDTIVVEKEDHWSVSLVDELDILPDPEFKWTMKKLSSDTGVTFKKNDGQRPVDRVYWATFFIKNNTSESDLTITSNYWDKVNLYLFDSTKLVDSLQIGILNKHYDAQTSIPANGSYRGLARFESFGKFRRESNINLNIRKTIFDLERKQLFRYLEGVIFGLIFGLAVFNFFLCISLRDITYVWYSTYLLLYAITYITLFIDEPSILTRFFISSNPQMAFYIKKYGDHLLWLSFAQFTRSFLQSNRRHPIWDRILVLLMILTVIHFLITAFNIFHFTGIGRVLLYNLTSLIALILAIISFFKGHKASRFFLLGQGFVFLGILIVGSYYVDRDMIWFLPKTIFFDFFRSPNSIFACAAIESVLFSFALAGKYNFLQKETVRLSLEKEMEKQALLAAQNETLESLVQERTMELRHSLDDLKKTQAQLVQAEKMASLGELTAGIAHEIQNPLNFINSFSEINVELLHELNEGARNSSKQDGMDNVLLIQNIHKNSQKINHHGKRIDGIVKSMLQHSRSSGMVREMADINQLCIDSIKLAYHGFRAKEKTFTSTFDIHLDPAIPRIRIVPQEFCRVILNMVNNAFYSVVQKQKMVNKNMEGGNQDDYEPKVTLFTKLDEGKVIIEIVDNGIGIDEEVKPKIFNPFFTTKPTGEGTGLGLSIAYDIVTKMFSGEIKVSRNVLGGATFTIIIPVDLS